MCASHSSTPLTTTGTASATPTTTRAAPWREHCLGRPDGERPDGRWRRSAVLGPAEPGVQLVDEYVRRDAHGERLGSTAWFLNNSVWENEPAYDRYTVVSQSAIEPLSGDSSTARVRVVQNVLGFVSGDGDGRALFTEERGVETTVFTAVLTDNGWRIAAPQRAQHVSVDSALRKVPFDSATRAQLHLLLRAP